MTSDKNSRTASGERGERLQKFLAHAGVASRRASEELIRTGEVTINGRVAELGDRVAPGDAVKVGNKLVQQNVSARLVLALNKPEGTITTRQDPEGRNTVFDLVPAKLRTGLLAIGRLDYGTEGLLLLTNDGELAQRVAHPRYGCTKTYRVKVRGEPEERSLDRLRRGLVLDGKRLQPATIERHQMTVSGKQRRAQKNTWWTVEIGEGRTRQVRKMFERIGHPVSRLQRVAVGPIRLGRLPKGELRELDESEVEALERSTRGGASSGGAAQKKARPKKKTQQRKKTQAKKKAPSTKTKPKAAPAQRKKTVSKKSTQKPAARKAGGRQGQPKARPKSKSGSSSVTSRSAKPRRSNKPSGAARRGKRS